MQNVHDLQDLPGQWYAVHTRSNFEKRVAAQLEGRGVAYYLPLHSVTSIWKDRRKQLEVPLFKGYVFANFVDTGGNRQSVLQVPGVAQIAGRRLDGEIDPVPAAELTAIHLLLKSTLSWEPHPYLTKGDRVRVLRGPLAGIEGIFLRHKSRSRLLISVPLLSQSIAAEMENYDVEPLESRTPMAVQAFLESAAVASPSSGASLQCGG